VRVDQPGQDVLPLEIDRFHVGGRGGGGGHRLDAAAAQHDRHVRSDAAITDAYNLSVHERQRLVRALRSEDRASAQHGNEGESCLHGARVYRTIAVGYRPHRHSLDPFGADTARSLKM
jgi:hypothetical protein